MSCRAEDRSPRSGTPTDHVLRPTWVAPSGGSRGLLADPTVHARTTGYDAPRRQRSDREANRRLERAEETPAGRAATALARAARPRELQSLRAWLDAHGPQLTMVPPPAASPADIDGQEPDQESGGDTP